MTYVYENRDNGEQREVEMPMSLSQNEQKDAENRLLGPGRWHRVPQLVSVFLGSAKTGAMYDSGRDDDRAMIRAVEPIVHARQTRRHGKPNDWRRADWQEAHAPRTPKRGASAATKAIVKKNFSEWKAKAAAEDK